MIDLFQLPLHESIAHAIGWALLNSVWQILLVSLGYLLVKQIIPSRMANLRYCLGMLSLLIIAVWPVLSGLNYFHTEQLLAAQLAGVETYTAMQEEAVWIADEAADQQANVKERLSAYFIHIGENLRSHKELFPILTLLWVLGAVFFSLRLTAAYYFAHQLRSKGTTTVPEEWQQQLLDLSKKLKIAKLPELYFSEQITSPLTLGYFKPLILFPLSMASGFSPQQLEAIMLHELAHIKRRDYLFNMLQSVVESLFFYHPLVWWISTDIRETREMCCDDQALRHCSEPIIYAETLTQIQLQKVSLLKTQLIMSFKGKKSRFSDRIYRIMGYQYEKLSPSRAGINAIVLTIGIILISFRPIDKQKVLSAIELDQYPVLEYALSAPDMALDFAGNTMEEEVRPTSLAVPQLDREVYQAESGDTISFTIWPETTEQEVLDWVTKIREYGTRITMPRIQPTMDGKIASLEFRIPDNKAPYQYSRLYIKKLKEFSIQYDPKTQKFMYRACCDTKVQLPFAKTVPYEISGRLDSPKVEKVEIVPNGEIRIRTNEGDSNQPMYVVNGKVLNVKEKNLKNSVNPEDIESINVLKGSSAINKYGDKAKNGVIEIQLKSGVKIEGAIINSTDEEALNKPLYFINGEEYDNADGSLLDALEPSDIASMDVLKGTSATALYGNRAANGVILITTKKGVQLDGKKFKKLVVGVKERPVDNENEWVEEAARDIDAVQDIEEVPNIKFRGKNGKSQKFDVFIDDRSEGTMKSKKLNHYVEKNKERIATIEVSKAEGAAGGDNGNAKVYIYTKAYSGQSLNEKEKELKVILDTLENRAGIHLRNSKLTGDKNQIAEKQNPKISYGKPTKTDFRIYPNPGEKVAKVRAIIPEKVMVSVQIMDAQGKVVKTLVKDQQLEGHLQWEWDHTDLPAGMYIVQLTAGKETMIQRLVK